MTSSISPGTGDEEAGIRSLIARWCEASAEGDLDAQLDLMTDDVLLLTPGQQPMSKDVFAAIFRAMTGKVQMSIDFDIQEVLIAGDIAVVRNRLHVRMTPHSGDEPTDRSGETLTILRRGEPGSWRVWRDANLME